MSKEPSDREEELRMIGSQLFHLEDEELLIIRGHLLTERYLWRYLGRKLFAPALSKEVNLRYAQLLSLSRLVTAPEKALDWFWEVLGNLNRVRNILAHELMDSTEVSELVDSIFKTVEYHLDFSSITPRSRSDKLHWLLAMLCTIAHDLEEYGASHTAGASTRRDDKSDK